jgi:hypothetical protein
MLLTEIFSLQSFTLVLEDFDYCFAENGLTAYRKGVQLPSEVGIGLTDYVVDISDARWIPVVCCLAELHQLDGRGKVPDPRQLLPPLHCRSRLAQEEVCFNRTNKAIAGCTNVWSRHQGNIR